ncbi:MAG: DNA gyrase subunit A [Gemmatimonadetes bacterium]|nr:DNA gyrase subunit A [Gemmatimonadota bacterium]
MAIIERRDRILPRLIETEMRESFIDYSMSVIVARALPDVRDGLKPVHRRVLYGMSELGLFPGRGYRKSAKVVGEVLGKFHPHGDLSVYDALARMVQDFSLRYPLVDGQGNWGSVDGDSPAAMRYTECRLTPVAADMLADIEKETVDYQGNFDDTEQEPTVLPTRVPNLLINGATGIAVGMATNIPPHNLGEVVDALVALVEDPELEITALRKLIKGPDFPTAGIIVGRAGIKDAYETGRGRVVMRARSEIEVKQSGREAIIVSEIPYQVNKSRLVEQIADHARSKRIEGISDLRDESDRDGMRIVIELKRDAVARVVLNQLYKTTQMQATFGVNLLALVNNVPRTLNLKEMCTHFLDHRHDVVVRRTRFELRKAEERAHILEGLLIALQHIDAIVQLIKKAKDVETAREQLMKKYELSQIQAQAILDMRLARLTGLERDKIQAEYRDLIALIARLKELLESRRLRMDLIKTELIEIRKKYADPRRTQITHDEGDFSVEDLIAEENMVITVTHRGYIKRTPTNAYTRQHRGGLGSKGTAAREEDFLQSVFTATTHDYILVLTQRGRCYWLKVYEIPQAGRAARGRPIVNLVELPKDDAVAALLPVKEFDAEHSVIMATERGVVKKTSLAAYGNPRAGGIIAMNIGAEDRLLSAEITDGSNDVILVTSHGQSIRFHETQAREMGRTAGGVRGIALREGDRVVGMVVVKRDGTLLVITENGYGKRTRFSDYRVQSRGGIGIKTVKVTDKTGKLVAGREVVDQDELMAITASGMTIRVLVGGLRVLGRATQGVRIIRLGGGDRVVDVARMVAEDEEGSQADGAGIAGVGSGAGNGDGNGAAGDEDEEDAPTLFDAEDE